MPRNVVLYTPSPSRFKPCQGRPRCQYMALANHPKLRSSDIQRVKEIGTFDLCCMVEQPVARHVVSCCQVCSQKLRVHLRLVPYWYRFYLGIVVRVDNFVK